jgi:hypothetical protein
MYLLESKVHGGVVGGAMDFFTFSLLSGERGALKWKEGGKK